ncbi:MAG: hypothetical protein FVQ77_12110 [Cytophagales bacterium]|nr:hypothetical protein [Cytophagales bacterium]
MKKIVIILLFSLCWACGYSQANKRIIEICDSLLGKKVGGGHCRHFTNYVLNKFFDNEEKYVLTFQWKDKFPSWAGRFSPLWERIPYDLTLCPGDKILIKRGTILSFTDPFEEQKFKRGHVAFIHHWVDECTVALIHQYKPKSVCIDNFEICKMYKGKMKITRVEEN